MSFKPLKHSLIAAVLAAVPFSSHAQKVMPVLVSTKYTLTMGNMSLQATAKNSGRIQSVKYSGLEVLHQDTSSATSYGSTFWPSPQAVWNWPPPANIDGNNFTASIDADSSITFFNATADNTTKLRVRKNYWANTADSSFNYRVTFFNTGTARPWSPWEDTRIDTGGIYLFPKGTDAITGAIGPYTTVDTSKHMVWYQHNNNNLPGSGTNKFYADGSQGWYAHVYANRLLLIKKFKDAPASKKAPSPEDEIEFYSTNKPLGNSSFIEMEVQGSYDTIKTNDSVSWDMKWYVRKLPDTMTVAIGNQAIVDYITRIVGTTTAIANRTSASPFPMKASSNRVSLDLAKTADVSLALVNSTGQTISRIHSGSLAEGHHDFRLESNIPKGVYWLVLKSMNSPQILKTQMWVRY